MKPILGTMTFGEQVDQDTTATMLEMFSHDGGEEIDTANVYCEGRTETFLGNILNPQIRPFIASKVHPWNDEGLQPKQIKSQLQQTLQRLGVDQIDLLYLHAPDLDTPIQDTLEACFEMFEEGKFREFGLSNYAAWQVAEIAELCRQRDWMQPTVYQGMYNALTRDVERELFPCLRNYGLRFYAYNPLAGGLLTGKYQSLEALPDDGRFGLHESYQQRYWKKDYFDVLQELQSACLVSGIKPAQAAMSWLLNHSLLDATHGDGIIIGASRIEQLTENMASFQQPPLDDLIVQIMDRGWDLIKPDCAKYFRP
jgi:aflatoxin B1 aldehyde reductase